MNLVGQSLGRYRILAKLGEGGMATVYRAHDTRIGRDVAIKVLPQWNRDDRSQVGRFIREVRLLADLSHPSIVGIFDFGQEGDVVYYVMEYLPGGSLAELLKAQGALPWAQVLRLARDVLSALECIHGLDVLHRDIKPHNILLSEEGDFKLADFGLGKAGDFENLTRTGEMIGTLKYLPPEGLEGQPMDRTSDLFQLGLVLYESSTGRRAFPGSTAVEILRAFSRDVPAPIHELSPEVPAPFHTLVSNLLQLARPDRYPVAAAVLADLSRVEKGQNVRARLSTRRTRNPDPAPGPVPRRLGLMAGAGLITFGLLGLVALVVGQRTPPAGGIRGLTLDPGSHRILVTWTSAAPYRGRVEYRSQGNTVVSVIEEEEQTQGHRVLVTDLAEGRDYLVRVREPGVPEVEERTVRTTSLTARLVRARAAGGGGVLEWSTTQPTRALIEIHRLGRVERLAVPGDPRTDHLVRYEDFGERLGYRLEVVASNVLGESVRLPVNDLVEERGGRLLRAFQETDIERVAEKVQDLGQVGTAAASRVVISGFLHSATFFAPLEGFGSVSAYYFGNPAFPVRDRIDLVANLQRLSSVQALCRRQGIDASFPIGHVLPSLGAEGPGEGATARDYDLALPGAPLVVQGSRLEYLDKIAPLAAAEHVKRITSRVVLDEQPAGLAGVRLLATGSIHEAVLVRFTVNGHGPLYALAPDPADPGSRRGGVPAGLLVARENEIVLELERAPGARGTLPGRGTFDRVTLQIWTDPGEDGTPHSPTVHPEGASS